MQGAYVLKKRLIKKQIKAFSDEEICFCIEYGTGFWKLYADKEFDRRMLDEWFNIKN